MPAKIEINTDETMRELANHAREVCGPSYGFMILVVPFGEQGPLGGTSHYISNVQRADMIKVLRDKADVLEKNMDIQNQGLGN